MFARTSAAAFTWVIGMLLIQAAPVSAADELSAPTLETLNFPDNSQAAPRITIAPLAQQQAAVPLPTPEFTGLTAIAALSGLLFWRKSILKLVC